MALPSKVKTGDPIKASDWNALIDCVRSAQINPGSGVRVTRTPSGTTLAVDKTPQRTVTLPRHPFQIIQGPASSQEPQIGVIANSHVINFSDKDAHEEDNSDWGLLSDDAADDDENWFVCPSVGSKIWLQFKFDDDGNLLETSVEYGQVGDDQWDEFPDSISINVDDPDNPWQEFYHLLIAEVTDPEQDPREGFQVTFSNGDKAQVTQILKTNVALVDATTTEDADEPNRPIMVAIPWTQPGTATDGSADEINAEEDVKTPWSFAGAVDDDNPFKLRGRVDEDGQGWITVAYGEVNEVPPTLDDGSQMGEGDAPYAMKADDDGVVFVTITLDPDKREVVSFYFDMAADEESIGDDDEETMHIVLGRFYIDTDADENGFPVPFNTVVGNINMSVEPVINADGRVCLDMVHTYLRDAAPTGFFDMEVFDTDEDGSPVDGCSSMFLSVGDTDDPSNDGLTFQANDNYLEIVWGADQNSEYPIPAIKFTDTDGNVSNIDTGGLSFWDSDGSEDNPQVDLSMDGLNIWDADGNGTLHDAGGISFWDNAANQSNPQCDLNLERLQIWDDDGKKAVVDAGGGTFTDDTISEGADISTLGVKLWSSAANQDNPDGYFQYNLLKMFTPGGAAIRVTPAEIDLWDSESSDSNPKLLINTSKVRLWDSDGDGFRADAGGVSLWDNSASESNPQCDLNVERLKIWDNDGDQIELDAGGLTITNSDGDTSNYDATNVTYTDSDGDSSTLDAGGVAFTGSDGDYSNLDNGGLTITSSSGDTANYDATNVSFIDSDGDSVTLDGGGITFTSGSDTANLDATGLTLGETTALTDGDLDLGTTGTVTINGKSYQPTTIADCNGKTLSILADSEGWQ